MPLDPAELPDDIAALKARLVAASLKVDDLDAEIDNLKLTIAKLQHDRFGNSSERTSALMAQLDNRRCRHSQTSDDIPCGLRRMLTSAAHP